MTCQLSLFFFMPTLFIHNCPLWQKPASNWECKWENEFSYLLCGLGKIASLSFSFHICKIRLIIDPIS